MKPLVFIDIESTGLDVSNDRIISLSLLKTYGSPDSWVDHCWLVNPGQDIPAAASGVHGMTNESVKDSPPFRTVAREVHNTLLGCDVAGFNIIDFDVPMLWEELFRSGIEWDMREVNQVDAGVIFKKMEQRTLTAAMKFYLNEEHAGAHDAAADTRAAARVLSAQIARYPQLTGLDIAGLAKFSKKDDRVDLRGTLVRNAEGKVVFNTQRNKGVEVKDNVSYAEWMLSASFPESTKAVIRQLLRRGHQKELGL